MPSNVELHRRPFPLTWLGCAPLLLLLLAVPASAQSSHPSDVVPEGTPLSQWPVLAPTDPPLVVEGGTTALDAGTADPAPVRRHGVVRVGAELGGGLLTSLGLGAAGALGGGLLGFGLCEGNSSHQNESGLCLMFGAIVGGSAGLGVGLPLGVAWGGGKAGGNGSLAAAFGGLGVSVASAGAAHLLGAKDLGALLLATAPVFTIIGYELTDSAPKAPTSVGVTPAVSVGSGGASFGLQGRF
ncbi:hypothetical protein [Pyxidicoccus trucidator]|uniref:hypothetical protein n=1 Tax=Pyxidicoccus trucidator TaxID=2709662 RepID=UPI0013DCC2E8|nr:hypothetical protein [Pyxidicoccus trucidator]